MIAQGGTGGTRPPHRRAREKKALYVINSLTYIHTGQSVEGHFHDHRNSPCATPWGGHVSPCPPQIEDRHRRRMIMTERPPDLPGECHGCRTTRGGCYRHPRDPGPWRWD